jgi:hypothetical protein
VRSLCNAMPALKINSNSPKLIAPCGINCRLCRAYVRVGKSIPCPGCRGENTFKAKSCVTCRIKNCEKIVEGKYKYCFECNIFPCARLKHLDKRYRAKYATSAIGNLLSIKEIGIRDFVDIENKKWVCPECGAMLCMHIPQCLSCGYVWYTPGEIK